MLAQHQTPPKTFRQVKNHAVWSCGLVIYRAFVALSGLLRVIAGYPQ
jgi:hypothetical protein